MTLADYARTRADAVELQRSPLESRRFGWEIYRLDLGERELVTAEEVAGNFRGSGADMLFLRYPADEVGWPARLLADDIAVLPADTLLYFRTDRTAAARRDTRGRRVEAGEADALASAVRSTFGDYSNHYRANPLLDVLLAEEGYVEWAVSSLESERRHVLWTEDADGPTGFAVCQSTGDEGEILLAGVLPAARGRGTYGDVLAAAEACLRDEGADHVLISTQAWNLVALRQWTRRGYLPWAAFSTLHLVGGAARQRLLGHDRADK